MKKCLLCREVVDIVNHDGLCDECEDYIESIPLEVNLNYPEEDEE